MQKAPYINIVFKELSKTVITRGERGVVGLIIQDTVLNDTQFTVLDEDDIPDTLTAENQTYIKRALLGNNTAPKKIIVYVMDASNDYEKAYNFINESTVDIVAFSKAKTDNKCEEIKTKINKMREDNHRKVMCVLPEFEADSEGIVSWWWNVKSGDTTIAPEAYCSRIAGAIAGTSIVSSITYMTLDDVDDCDRKSDDEIDTAVGAGKLVPMWDGEKVKIVNDVTTFQTTTEEKSESFKVIKLIRDMDMVYSDLYKVVRDEYIGKYTNSYDNQCVLKTAITDYLNGCVEDGIFESASIDFDIESKRKWVKTAIAQYPDKFDKTYEEMTDEDIKKCWSSNKVWLRGKLSLLDTLKEVEIPFYV